MDAASPSLSSKSESRVEARFPLQEYFVPRPSCARKTLWEHPNEAKYLFKKVVLIENHINTGPFLHKF
ncbi:hypothetical protein H6P81_003591 [Aristolochia fimbriata]|uniref:Uncharacterized protein n=1 Tax=Aristolochia fimbriata TaxID=158543 RepID=A0AAV7FD92_ARIFI|nr:hypothetical protein H6P81_003591 [Aristolochia fimbriata]